MTKLFGINLPAVVASTIPDDAWPAASLIRVTYAARDPDNPASGKTPTETSHSTRGIDEASLRAGSPAGSSMRADKDATICLLGNPLGSIEPAANDLISIGGVRWRIASATPDPARAVWRCSCRPA